MHFPDIKWHHLYDNIINIREKYLLLRYKVWLDMDNNINKIYSLLTKYQQNINSLH